MNTPKFFESLPSCRANVIWPENCARDIDIYALFRKTFSLSGGTCTLRIFADTYYNLFVDGSFLHRGPVRRHETHAEFDTLTLELSPGEHVIAVLVHHLGVACAGHRKGRKAFWCELESGNTILVSDNSWKATYCDAFQTDGQLFSHYDFCEDVDMRRFPTGWETVNFDDSLWPSAQILCAAGSEEDIHKNYTRRTLKLFSYPQESGQLIQTGFYSEQLPMTETFIPRFFSRAYSKAPGDGTYTLAQFPATISGCAEIHYENAEDGAELIIGYDDFLDETGFVNPGRAARCADRFVLPQGRGTVKVFMPRGFRYVLATISGQGKILSVTAGKEEYPYEEKKGFSSGLSFWTNLYDQSVRTQQICTIDGFTDCVNRERVLWLGDAYLDCLGAYYSTADKGLLLTTLYEHALGQGTCGALGGYNSSDLQPDWLYMPSYNLMYIHILCDYILYTGDEENVLPLKNTIRGILRFIQDNINERGIFDTAYKGCSGYWDWGYVEPAGEALKTTAYFIHTVERMARFAFFDDVVDDELLCKVASMKQLCRDVFWDREKLVYRDSTSSCLTTQAATAYAVISGICGPEQAPDVLRRITDHALLDAIPVGENQENSASSPDESKILPAATMYGATVVCRALFESGLSEEALDYMYTVWGDFEGLPTLPELRRNGSNNTMCHGWSASPAFLLPMYVLGLRPLENGCKEVLFAPPLLDPAILSSAKGSMPTPFGTIYAQWTRHGKFLKVDFELPKDISLRLEYSKTARIIREPGKYTLYLPC